MLWLFGLEACGILAPDQGTCTPCIGMCSFSHWTAREIPRLCILKEGLSERLSPPALCHPILRILSARWIHLRQDTGTFFPRETQGPQDSDWQVLTYKYC